MRHVCMCACVHQACLHGNENVCAWPDVMDSTVTLVVLEPLPHLPTRWIHRLLPCPYHVQELRVCARRTKE